MVDIQGEAAVRFAPVREAFARNFEEHGDVGAAFCLYVKGEKVVDLWGGVRDADSGDPWEEDTLQLVFSTTKAATAASAHLLAQRGELDYDAPVSSYWPEFKAAGKESIPVRWLLSHRAGLPVIDAALTHDEVLAWDPVIAALAAQKPVWEPGTAHGYHALTYGWLVGEVVRRISGRSLGTFFADEIAGPLGLEFWVGLPAPLEARVSRLIQLAIQTGTPDLSEIPEEFRQIAEAFLNPDSLTNRALNVTKPPLDWNEPAVHAAEIPAANGICTARSLARFYAGLIGSVEGVRILSPSTVAAATVEQSHGADKVLFAETRFGLGFFLPSTFEPMAGAGSFGHSGAGGSLGFADTESGIAFGYVMNRMQTNLGADPRTAGLVAAVKSCL